MVVLVKETPSLKIEETEVNEAPDAKALQAKVPGPDKLAVIFKAVELGTIRSFGVESN